MIQTIPIDQQMAILIGIALLTLAWLFISSRRKQHLKFPLPPGPRGIPIFGNLPFIDPQFHSYLSGLAQTYGHVLSMRLGRKIIVVISSPAMAREVLKENDVTFANRDVPNVLTATEFGRHDVVFTPYGSEWKMLRQVCSRNMIGHTAVVAFSSYRRQEVRNTIKYFYRCQGSPVNVGEQMFLNMLNLVTNMLWGDTVKGGGVGTEFRQVVADLNELLGKPNVSDFFPGLAWLDLQGIREQMKRVVARLEATLDEKIGQRTKTGNHVENKDLLQLLLQLKDGSDPKAPLTMIHVKALLLDMVVGGTETTSSILEFAMAEMINKPDLMIRAQQELDSVVGNMNTVEESHLSKLPFLNAAMKEALRLHPSLPLLVPHCPSADCVIGNYTVPEGSRVLVNVWAIHRDPSIWENPMEFIPDRFLNGKGDYSGNDFSYMPFGSGRRICPGMPTAERILMHLVASLIHCFDWKLPDGEKLDMSEKFGIVVKKRTPLVAIPVPRLSNSTLYN